MPASRRTLRAAGLAPAHAAPARLRVGVIGAGRVGAVLGAALAAAGHDVVAAAGLSAASAERAARLLPGVPLLPPTRSWPPPTWSCSPFPTTPWPASSPAWPRPAPGDPAS